MAKSKNNAEEQPKNEAAEKAEALRKAMENLNKKYNDGAVIRLGDIARRDIPCIPTGILPLDVALGIGGIPRGRIIEIYGPESSGKTTVTLYMIASAQKLGGTAAFIDAEHALDPIYAKKLGVNIDELIVSQPDNGEQGLEIADKLISSGAIDIIVIDSVAALVPKAEIDGEMGELQVGLHARMMSKAMRKLAGTISKTDTIAIFINQLREKVGGFSPFGPAETTTGGRALKFYSSVRIDVRKGEPIRQGGEQIGNKVKLKIAKNKVAPPFRTAEFDLIYGQGYSRIGGILTVGVGLEIIKKSGGSHYYESKERFAKSSAEAEQYLVEHPEIADEIERKIHERLRSGEEIPDAVAPMDHGESETSENFTAETFDE